MLIVHFKYPHRDSKRVLECLQKALRIANSAIEEIVTVQLYCDTLDHYLYYLYHNAPAVRFLLSFCPQTLTCINRSLRNLSIAWLS